MPTPDTLSPPWSQATIDTLNAYQTGTQDGWPVHPYTCGLRGNSGLPHGEEGGDLGVLIATGDGWVCPHCDYTQTWALALPTEIAPTLLIGPNGPEIVGPSREERIALIDQRIRAYGPLAATGARGAEAMLDGLRRRRDALSAPAAPIVMWVVYDHPSDFPTNFVARRFVDAQPTTETRLASNLDALRTLLPPGLSCALRHPSDDPAIVEMWS